MAVDVPESSAGEDCKTLYFGNLPTDATPEALEAAMRAACLPYGDVLHVRAARFGTGKHRQRRDAKEKAKLNFGHGYAYFTSSEIAASAIQALSVSLQCSDKANILSGATVGPALKAPPIPPTEKELAEAAAVAKERAAKRAEKGQQKARARERDWDTLEKLIEGISEPGGANADRVSMSVAETVSWERVPAELDPQRGGGLGGADHQETVRSQRKRQQVEVFAAWLRQIFKMQTDSRTETIERRRVVDFGCGSGNVTLPLAFLFPEIDFVAVDMKHESIRLLVQKAQEGGLENIQGHVGMIESFQEPFDLALALHACGNATDHAMLKAAEHRAAFVMSPCCVGKLKFSVKGGSSFSTKWTEYKKTTEESEIDHSFALQHPRSVWLRSQISEDEFEKIATTADFAKDHARSVQVLCKLHVEIDRSLAMQDLGYFTCVTKMSTEEGYAQNYCIAGVHGDGVDVQNSDVEAARLLGRDAKASN